MMPFVQYVHACVTVRVNMRVFVRVGYPDTYGS